MRALLAIRDRRGDHGAVPERVQAMQRYAHLFIIIPVFLLDQWAKRIVVECLAYGRSHDVFSWLSIVHWRNTGGLFGFMSQDASGRLVFLVIPLAVIAGLLYYLVA